MNHQIYHDWLFTASKRPDEQLSAEQRSELRAHINECAECQQLEETWQSLSIKLRTVEMVSPAGGFVNRWQERLVVDRLHRHRRQIIILFLVSLSSAAAIILAMVSHSWYQFQSNDLLFWTDIYQTLRWVSAVALIQQNLVSFWSANRFLWLLLVLAIGAAMLSQLAVIFFISYFSLAAPRRTSK